MFDLKSVKQIIQECKRDWKGEQTPPQQAQYELQDRAADLVNKTISTALQTGKFSAASAYKQILEANGENMNQKDKKNLRKKLKRKQKKIKRQNPDFLFEQPDQSDPEDHDGPEDAPERRPVTKAEPASNTVRPHPLEIIEDPFE